MADEYTWASDSSDPKPGNPPEAIAGMERSLGVSFPTSLRDGYLFSDSASIFKRGILCDEVVTGPKDKGGDCVGYFGYLEGLNTIPNETVGLQEWVDDVFERELPDVFPFATLGGGGWTCLNYQNDPTRANPEIWQFDMNGTSFDDCFTKVADTFDHLIEMLVSEDDLARLGFA
ncbi:MAG: SMI1/KNR4 family protein [Pseudomonadota bacterium]